MGVATNTGPEFELIPTGTYQALCIASYDLGKQKSVHKNVVSYKEKVVLIWEVNKRMEFEENAGKRFTIPKKYTLSLHENARLRKDLENWRGKAFTKEEIDLGFETEKLIGKECMITIVHSDWQNRTYANVSAVVAKPEGTPPLIQEIRLTETPKWIKKAQAEALTDQPAHPPEDSDYSQDVPPDTESEVPF